MGQDVLDILWKHFNVQPANFEFIWQIPKTSVKTKKRNTEKKTVILPNFLERKFCGKAQICPKLCENYAFFNTKKIDEVMAFFIVKIKAEDCGCVSRFQDYRYLFVILFEPVDAVESTSVELQKKIIAAVDQEKGIEKALKDLAMLITVWDNSKVLESSSKQN